MKAGAYDLCAYCPRLCRHVCPVAVGSAREAATPTAMMAGPWAWLQGHLDGASAGSLAALCTDCGACTAACKLERPVGDLLSKARGRLLPAATVEPIPAIEGDGNRVVVECDSRPWASAFSGRFSAPVACLRTGDHLGVAVLDHPGVARAHLSALRARVGQRTLVVSCADCARVGAAAGLSVEHLAELIRPDAAGAVHQPCRGPRYDGTSTEDALLCCGAGHALRGHHPSIAAEVGRAAAERLGGAPHLTSDSRCGTWLRDHGANMTDPVDLLLATR